MNIQTVQFAHILENRDLEALHDFLSQTAFVISHKNESIETILKVLWYLPANSTIIIVSNCAQEEQDELVRALKTHMADHRQTYFIHQKDAEIARLFQEAGVATILGADGKVINGKGEGMYIGALGAYQLGYPRWLVFYDADNFVPSALLEYTLAMCRLFMAASHRDYDPLTGQSTLRASDLHNVRICWSSKPDLDNRDWSARILGRTTRVVSPLFESLVEGWFGIYNHPIRSSNAGEQGMTVKTAASLRFSSGFSVETFQLLDLLFNATEQRARPEETIFQQYLSQSPHFHEKKDDEHIKKMIEESLGCFFHFEAALPDTVKEQLLRVYAELQLERIIPTVYPSLQDLHLEQFSSLMQRYALFADANIQEMPIADLDYQDLLPVIVKRQELLTEMAYQTALGDTSHLQEMRETETSYQNLLTNETGFQNFLVND